MRYRSRRSSPGGKRPWAWAVALARDGVGVPVVDRARVDGGPGVPRRVSSGAGVPERMGTGPGVRLRGAVLVGVAVSSSGAPQSGQKRAEAATSLAQAVQRVMGTAASYAIPEEVIRMRARAMRLLRPPENGDAAPGHGRVAWLFLRLLGLVYLFAFLSLERELEGLVGPAGLLPAAPFLKRVVDYLGSEAYWRLPSLFWIPGVGAGRAALHGAAIGGAVLAGLVVLGFLPRALLAVLWALYLSFMAVGQVFLGYQWDSLLVETGLLALVLAPGGRRPRAARESEPAPAALWLLRLLLFRLMLSSGLVKLLSGDPTWRDLTALSLHYETQPLPTWIGYFAHQMPLWVHKLSCAAMFATELVVPLFVFAGRRMRLVGAVLMAGLQLLIGLTGNYTFFNLLTIGLCLTLLDDGLLPRFVRERLPEAPADANPRALAPFALAPFAVVFAIAAAVRLSTTVGLAGLWPGPIVDATNVIEPFGVAYPYGLFAVMTTSRLEIEVQGSRDGREWRPYAFRWKPGDVRRRPGFVEPFQPRLDWQMWFAALQSCDQQPWLWRLFVGLMNDEPVVLDLLDGNPFADGAPPRFVRAVQYDYRFTDLTTWKETDAWWRREPQGLYCPVVRSK
jgi:lipase maturation factor 1